MTWFQIALPVVSLLAIIILEPQLQRWIENNFPSVSDCRGFQAMGNAMVLSVIIVGIPMLIIAWFIK
jgi:hypothetical protein